MRWAAVAVAVSVHGLSCFPLATFGTPEQQERWLPDLLGGGMLGAYSLSEPQAGSDAAALACQAERDGDEYVITGTKAWITSAGKADFVHAVRPDGPGQPGGLCFLVPAGLPGLSFGEPEKKMGLRGVPTASAHYDGLRLPADRRIGAEGQGLRIAFSALDSGRLGIAAIAVGLAQAALDYAVGYARERQTFGQPIIEHEGLAFLLADMAAAVHSARATYLDAARRRDAGRPYSEQASVAKLVATDAAMKVTTDAVQVLGGYGYSQNSRSSGTCARPRSCRFSRARTRSSASSSAATWPHEPGRACSAGAVIRHSSRPAPPRCRRRVAGEPTACPPGSGRSAGPARPAVSRPA